MKSMDKLAHSIARKVAEAGPYILRCGVCGTESDCTTNDMTYSLAHGWPKCCQKTMLLVRA